MTRSSLLRTLSVAALSAFVAPASFASSTIQGGGGTSPAGDYIAELALFNGSQSAVQFGTYWAAGSAAQTGFLNDDLTCDINKVTGGNGGNCAGSPGGANAVQYAESDAILNSTQVSGWTTSAYGQSLAGNLIQIPMLGTAQAIVVNDTNITSNGQLTLSDADLCGIFSGKITDFSGIKDSATAPAAGPITLVYRNDAAAATFQLTNHLAAVCTTGAGGNSNITFTATTTFASLFPSGNVLSLIPNAIGQKGAGGVANYMAGLTSAGAVPQAIGYVSPDWTSLDPKSNSLLSNGQPSPLLVSGVKVGKVAYIPTTKNITTGLSHVAVGSVLTPPTNAAQGADPTAWVPVIQTVKTGYPIVAYGTFDLAQCYSDPAVKAGLVSYLKLHYANASYISIQTNNGLVRIANSGASKFLAAVQKNILANSNGWNTDIGDKVACKGLTGR